MTSLNTQLWELITTHKLPDDASGRPFIEQLMAEHRITRATATVAIREYQKFMYLCALRSERNVPSQAVDLVWHLHMQHSRDYWDVFCKKLGKSVHHSPGSPSGGDGSQHLDDYKATVHAYRDLFGPPPKGIWRQTDNRKTLLGLIVPAVLLCMGVLLIAQEGDLMLGVLWISVSAFVFVTTLNSLTAQGQVTLVFECNDPFADDDAGDCGSGDGGGCGD